jgi:hypothetical protein
MTPVRLGLFALLSIPALADVSQGHRPDYFPVSPQARRTYKMSTGQQIEQKFLGREKLDGAECLVLDGAIFLGGQQGKMYMSVSRDGVRIHGWELSSQKIVIKPAMLFLRYPVRPGQRWVDESKWDYESLSMEFRVKVTAEIQREERLEVTAGRFRCLPVQCAFEFDVQGMKQTADMTLWFAAGVGLVKQRTVQRGAIEQSFELESFKDR